MTLLLDSLDAQSCLSFNSSDDHGEVLLAKPQGHVIAFGLKRQPVLLALHEEHGKGEQSDSGSEKGRRLVARMLGHRVRSSLDVLV